MEVGLTEEVRKMCGLRPLPAPTGDADPFLCWDMARVDLGARKLLIAANVATRACAVTRMTAADWKHIDQVVLGLAQDAAISCGCSPSQYASLAGEARLTKTHGRRAIGCMADASSALSADRIDMSERLQWCAMELINHRIISKCAACDGYAFPAERFAECLAAHLAE